MKHKSLHSKQCRSKNGCRRLLDKGISSTSHGCGIQSDFDRRREHGVCITEKGDHSTHFETPLSQLALSQLEEREYDEPTSSNAIIEAPDPDLSIPIEVAIMNDLSKRMQICEVSNEKAPTKKRRLHFNPGHLKTIPSSIFRAFRGIVQKRGTKQPPIEKSKSANSPVELFHLPFNLVPTEAKKDKSETIICPGLNEAITFPFYFGNIDRHEAARVLEGLDHGFFLLRDSWHPDFKFAVSFRCSDATVHARICYNNGKYTFKMNDELRFSSCNLLEFLKHYNYVERSIFDEPFLLKPVNRKQPFSLQSLCIASVASRCTPKSIETLPIPQTIKENILQSFAAI